MGLPASQYVNTVSAETTTLTGATVLRRIVVNTGVAAGTIVITETDGSIVALIDAAAVRNDQYDVKVNGLVIVTDDNALDVTIAFD